MLSKKLKYKIVENNIKTLALSRESVLTLAFVGVATFAPLLHSQLVTGTIVNAALFAAVAMVGLRAAITVAAVPSLIALAVGTLPAPLALMVPYIICSNLLLVLVFSKLHGANYWIGAVLASAGKFAFLFSVVGALAATPLLSGISPAIAAMMGVPQLVTAFGGSVLAYAVLRRVGGIA